MVYTEYNITVLNAAHKTRIAFDQTLSYCD